MGRKKMQGMCASVVKTIRTVDDLASAVYESNLVKDVTV
jgi:hypothetical protein